MKTNEVNSAAADKHPLRVQLSSEVLKAAKIAAASSHRSVEEYILDLLCIDLAEGARPIQMHLSPIQIHIMLQAIEALFQGPTKSRGLECMKAEVSRADARWRKGDSEGGFCYEIIKMAPVYRQLLDEWKKDPLHEQYIMDFSNAAELKRDASAALAALQP